MVFNSDNKQNTIFAIATHDPRLISEAIELSRKFGTDRRKFEFQLLKGISNEMKTSLVKQGFRDGTAGFIYSFMMSFHSFLVRSKLYMLSLSSRSPVGG